MNAIDMAQTEWDLRTLTVGPRLTADKDLSVALRDSVELRNEMWLGSCLLVGLGIWKDVWARC